MLKNGIKCGIGLGFRIKVNKKKINEQRLQGGDFV